ncbi:hypothetical protein BKA67DRAFT_537511 [Truncatella angustata]|uniref:Uncharacterized protein n=1 Tax=Truncatella angustata TaxID=152316 RepID=A0A9P8UGD4_9PEZI|nr:uncharacterized protein BKA67DRAFT_537511 [Truncatella angustata]KAH6651650.1 hypothetical protein BKA67DRAFT_537511 [Truncatella angustata]
MATAAVQPAIGPWKSNGAFWPAIIPGSGLPVELQALDVACRTYNALPPIEEQAKLYSSQHIKALLAIINSHDMGNLFGVHSPHRQGPFPPQRIKALPPIPRRCHPVGDFSKARAMDAVPTGELEVVWCSTKEEFTVVVPLDRIVDGIVEPVLTGWNVKDGSQENTDSEPPAGQSWAKAVVGTKETHKVFVSKSHNAQAVTPELLNKALVDIGVIEA